MVIIITILIVSIISLISVKLLNENINEKNILIKVDKKIVKEISIDKSVDKKYSFNFGREKGFLQVKNGKVRMLQMNDDICPRKICSETRWIENSKDTIVCLPNKIVVSLEATDKENEDIDVLSF
ncbi:MAG: NusG domain II-containing protein [Senegalia sp. (in: firmicutes)]